MMPMEAGLERRLVVLMAARLGLSAAALGIALGLDALGFHATVTEWRGFYATVACAFLATVGYGLLLPRVRRKQRFAVINIATDIIIVSALVFFSGGSDSVFTFLYVLVAVYGATLFQRSGALISGGVSALAYGAVLMASQPGWDAVAGKWPVLLTVWGVQAGAVLLVAALSSFLAADLRQTREVLDQRTSDLHRLQNLHRRSVESMMTGLLTVDLEGRVTSFNPEAGRITGLDSSSVLGRDIEDVLPGVRSQAIVYAADGGGSKARARMRHRNARGEELHLGVVAYVLRDDGGEARGHVVVFQDVTEVVAMEHDLRRSERLAAVGQLSASIAHEIRNPLAAISGAIQTLSRVQGGSGEAKRLVDIAVSEAERLNQLISDFLTYARPGPCNPEPVAVAEAVAGVLALFESVRPDRVNVDVSVEAGLGVHADPDQFRQVLWNLVLNASQAMPEGGSLRISAREVDDEAPQAGSLSRRNGGLGKSRLATAHRSKQRRVEIVIADEGVGVPAEAVDQIFEPFFTTKPDGSGLGLATVYRIVEDHGGNIHVDSVEGAGTMIRVQLPRAEAPE